MKTISNVDERVNHFQDGFTEEQLKQLPTYRQLFRAAVGMGLSKSGDEAIELYQVALKLKLTEPNLNLEDAEFKVLKKACDSNPAQWMAFYHAQVMLRLKEAEKGGEVYA